MARRDHDEDAADARLRLAVEAGRLGTWEWVVATNELAWSPSLEEVFGLPPGGFAGTFDAYLDLVHAEDRPAVERAIAEALEQRASDDFFVEFRSVRPGSGEIRWMEGRGSVLRDAEGTAVRMIGVGADVTERKQADLERGRQALALNDEVVQGLAIAKLALELGQPEAASESLGRALEAARVLVGDLLAGPSGGLRYGAGQLRRTVGASS